MYAIAIEERKLLQKERLRVWRKKHPQKVKENNSAYYQAHKEERRAYNKEYRKKHPEKRRQEAARYRQKYPEREKAHHAVMRIDISNETCSECVSKENLQKYHPDYTRPTYLTVLYKKCHDKLKVMVIT